MALTGDLALCTVADVELELGVAVGSTAGEALDYLEGLVDSLSEIVEVYLGRGPLRYRSGIVESPEGRLGVRVRLRTTPIREIASIRDNEVTLSVDDYLLQDEGRTGIVYFRLGAPFSGGFAPGTSADRLADTEGQDPEVLEVTYDGGWWLPEQGAKPVEVPPVPDLPRDIRRAVALSAAQQFKRRGVDRSVTGERLLSHSVSYDHAAGSAAGLPGFTEESARVLRRRRRISQA